MPGAAPGLVAGVFQVNARIPANTPSGNQPVVVTVGDKSTPDNVTVTVLGPDGRIGGLAYNNTGSTTVTVNAYDPANPSKAILLGTVAAGKYFRIGAAKLDSDLGSAGRFFPDQSGFSAVHILSGGQPGLLGLYRQLR